MTERRYLQLGDKIGGHRIVRVGRDHRPPPPPRERGEDYLSYDERYTLTQLGLRGSLEQCLAVRRWRR